MSNTGFFMYHHSTGLGHITEPEATVPATTNLLSQDAFN